MNPRHLFGAVFTIAGGALVTGGYNGHYGGLVALGVFAIVIGFACHGVDA